MPAGLAAGLSRPNRAEVDLDILTANTRIVAGLGGSGTLLFGAVKGNGYGLGLPEVARAMLAGGAGGFTLADPADAARIRAAGISEPILLYGGILPSAAAADGMRQLDLMCTVTDPDAARAWSAAARGHPPVRVFAKVDVGLERLGVYPGQAAGFARLVGGLPGLELAGIYTHLHGSPDRSYTDWQLSRFDEVLAELDRAGISVPLRMSQSSATLGLPGARPGTAARANAMDPGHLLYGILPAGRISPPAGLRPALRALVTRVIQVRQVSRDDFTAQSPVPGGITIAVIPIGRGDGLRSLTNGQVRVRGQLAPIVGPLSLEHARVDVTGVPGCQPGDVVEIIAGPPGSGLSAAEVAAANQLDQVGLLMEIRPSVPRVYLRRGQEQGQAT
ncbi:MAG TPA: alanine racemase [Streptosporangiaceae bacterium]|jgi:alanine racemase